MNKDTFDLSRVKGYLERNPDSNIIIISSNKRLSQEYWERIQGHLGIKKRPFIVTNHKYSMDGLPFMDSLVLKIGRWWENKNAKEAMLFSNLAKMTLPITFIPPFVKGGEDNPEK